MRYISIYAPILLILIQNPRETEWAGQDIFYLEILPDKTGVPFSRSIKSGKWSAVIPPLRRAGRQCLEPDEAERVRKAGEGT